MSSRLVVVLIAVLIYSCAAHKLRLRPRHGRIVGGKDASIINFPHQISLQYDSGHMCGGSIISNKYVVTAGHCTFGVEPQDLSVRANTSVVESGGVVTNVKKIYRNSNYNPYTIDYDISILELETPLIFGLGIGAISLPQGSENLSDGTTVQVTGWGTTQEYTEDLSTQLQVVEVTIIDREVCKKDYADENIITERMICAGSSKGGRDSCQGDSGGPLIANSVLYGIVSWGYGCAEQGFPGVYGNVAALRSYITEITGI